MITVLSMYEVQPGREQEFEELWRQTHPQRASHPGLRTERLLRHLDQRGHYVVLHEWEGREQFDAHMRAAGITWLLDDSEIWLSPPSFSYWEDVDEVAESS
jgi:heme-degrading monooxygenase HmoA